MDNFETTILALLETPMGIFELEAKSGLDSDYLRDALKDLRSAGKVRRFYGEDAEWLYKTVK